MEGVVLAYAGIQECKMVRCDSQGPGVVPPEGDFVVVGHDFCNIR